MDNSSTRLATALRRRLAIIADEESRRDPASHMEKLRKISAQINELAAALPKPVDPRLQHYLERSSYDKALELLDATAEGRLPGQA